LTRCNAGINIAIKMAIMAITTNSSISVKPFVLAIISSPIKYQISAANPSEAILFEYLTLCFFRASVKLIFWSRAFQGTFYRPSWFIRKIFAGKSLWMENEHVLIVGSDIQKNYKEILLKDGKFDNN
jgi:hypothetical protein